MRTFRFARDLWLALDEAAKADQALALAADIIQDYLDKNSDPAVQALYLRQPKYSSPPAPPIGEFRMSIKTGTISGSTLNISG